MGRPRKITIVADRDDTNGRPVTVDSPFTVKEAMFIDAYMESGDLKYATKVAGFAKPGVATGEKLLSMPHINKEVKKRTYQMKRKSVASAEEVMKYFSDVMRGEIKDQFGLEAPLSERTRAAQELAKRTIDIENKINGKADNEVVIKLDWGRD